MIRKIRTYKTWIASGLLISFASIFICDFLCDTGITFPRHDHSQPVVINNGHLVSGHNHDDHHDGHGHNHDQKNIQTKDHHHDRPDESADDCCDDLTYPFFASLASSMVKKVSSGDLYKVFTYLAVHFENILLKNNLHLTKTPDVY